jgi:hypothetical protein
MWAKALFAVPTIFQTRSPQWLCQPERVSLQGSSSAPQVK